MKHAARKQPVPVTIEDMEESAKQEKDGRKNYKIRGKWLECNFREKDNAFHFTYNSEDISREEAINWLLNR